MSTWRRSRTGDYLYAVGGRALSPDKNSAALERYDPATDRWQRLPDMPTARGGLGAAIAGGRLFAVGGETSTRALGTVESYNIARKAWSSAPSMRTPRHGLAVAAIGRSLYSLGGAPRPGHASASATAEATRLAPGRRIGEGWRRLPPMPTARQNMGSAVAPLLAVEDLGGVDQAVVGLAAGDHDPIADHGGRARRARAAQGGQLGPASASQGEHAVGDLGAWIDSLRDPAADHDELVLVGHGHLVVQRGPAGREPDFQPLITGS